MRRAVTFALVIAPAALLTILVAEACGGAYDAAPDDASDANAADASIDDRATPQDGGADARIEGGEDAEPPACELAYGESNGTLPSTTTMCGGITVDISASSRNCGACGHDCLTATCLNGRCTQEIVVTTTNGEIANVLGLAGERLFWASFAGSPTLIRSHPLDGGTFSAFMNQPDGGDVAFRGIFTPTNAYVFWNAGPVLEKPVDSSSNAVVVVADDPSNIEVTHMAANTTHLYYGKYSQNVVLRVGATGGTAESLASSYGLTAMAADEDAAYWTGGTFQDAGAPGPGSITRYDAKTGAITRSPSSGHPRAIAIDAKYAYVVDADDGAFRRFEKNDLQKPSVKLAAWTGVLGGMRTMTVQGGYIYAQIDVNASAEIVVRVPVCGGAPVVIANAAQTAPFALDGKYVYVASFTGIARVAR